MASALEAAMLVCFGFSWPINLIKNIKARTAKSMSLQFILLIIFGYVAGITAKIINHNINYVLIIYLINLFIVSINVVVYFANRRIDKKQEVKEITQTMSTTSKRVKTEIESKYSEMNKVADKNGVVLFGSSYFSSLPFVELGKCFNLNESLYNRSIESKSIDELCDMAESCVFELLPSKVFINIGEQDILESNFDINEFIAKYEWLLYTINSNTDAEIYIVSVLSNNDNAFEVNSKLKSLANEYGCEYIDITTANGCANQDLKVFSILKAYMRTHPIDFYEAINTVTV